MPKRRAARAIHWNQRPATASSRVFPGALGLGGSVLAGVFGSDEISKEGGTDLATPIFCSSLTRRSSCCCSILRSSSAEAGRVAYLVEEGWERNRMTATRPTIASAMRANMKRTSTRIQESPIEPPIEQLSAETDLFYARQSGFVLGKGGRRNGRASEFGKPRNWGMFERVLLPFIKRKFFCRLLAL